MVRIARPRARSSQCAAPDRLPSDIAEQLDISLLFFPSDVGRALCCGGSGYRGSGPRRRRDQARTGAGGRRCARRSASRVTGRSSI
jgi:hypothetical protein